MTKREARHERFLSCLNKPKLDCFDCLNKRSYILKASTGELDTADCLNTADYSNKHYSKVGINVIKRVDINEIDTHHAAREDLTSSADIETFT